MSYGLIDLTKDILKDDVNIASSETIQARIAICNACPDLSKLRACKHCGCFMDVKVRFSKSSCPIDKWFSAK